MHLLSADARPTPAPADDGAAALVFRTARRGAVFVSWRGRRVRLDRDSWIVLDAAEPCAIASDCRGDPEVLAVSVAAAECELARRAAEADPARGAVGELARSTFADTLRAIDGPVGRRLQAIGAGRAARRGAEWERAERIALVRDAIDEEQRLRARGDRLACVKAATRDALLRRLLIAADFIATNHDEPLSLDQMARAGSLSRYHFARLFALVHGATPHAYLLQKRTAAARRHLAEGVRCGDACARAGFGSRSTLFRNLRKSPPASEGSGPCSRSA